MSGPVWPVVDATPGGVIRTSQGRAMLAADVAAWEWSRATLYTLPHGSQPVGTRPPTLVRLPQVPAGLARRVRVIVRRTTAGSASELEVSIGTETVTVTVGAGVGVYTATGTLPQVESGADVVFEAEVKTAAFVGTVTVHLLPATEVTPMGDNQIWIRDLFANRPTVGIDSGDLLLLTDGAEAGWVYEYDGANWVLRRSIVSTWGDRPLPGTLPSGAVLDGDSRVEVAAVGRGVDIRFAWDTGLDLWLLESALSLSIDEAFRGDTALSSGERIFALEPVRGLPDGTGTAASGLTSNAADYRVRLTGATVFGVDKYPYQQEDSSASSNARLDIAGEDFGSGADAITLVAVAARLRDPAPAAPATDLMCVGMSASGGLMSATLYVDSDGVCMQGRRSSADGVGQAVGAAETLGDYFAVIGEANFATGDVLLWQEGGLVDSSSIPGTPGTLPSHSAAIRTGFAGLTPRGMRRRGFWGFERALTDEERALVFAIIIAIQRLPT